jgi:MFS family permease
MHMGGIESLAANLVPNKNLPNGYALISAGYFATRLTGPGVVAPLIDVLPLGWIFLISVGLYSVGVSLTIQIRTISTGVVEPAKSVLYNVFSGFRYVYNHGVLRNIMFLVLFHCSLVMSFETLLPAISKNRLAAGGEGVAYMHMMIGFGALLVSIGLAPLRGEGLRGRLFLVAAVISSIGNIILGIAPTLPLAMLGAVVIGVSQTGFMTIAIIMIQSVTPDGFRGRVTSVYLIHAGGIMAFSYFANGVLADVFDPGWILIVGAFAFLAVVFISFFRPTPRRLYLAGVPV